MGRVLFASLVPFLAAAALAVAPPARADDDAFERRLKQAKRQIQELQSASEHARELGKMEQAQKYAVAARNLARELEEMVLLRSREKAEARKQEKRQRAKRQREVRAKGKSARRPERLIHDLARAIEALKAIDADEDLIHGLAEQIERIKRRAKPQARKEGARAEREIVEGWLEVMHLAKRTLLEADRHDAAHIVEHGMHALELALEGRRDAEAMEIRREAPSRPAQARVLYLAAELLQKHGKRKEARWIQDLARRFAGREGGPRGQHGPKQDGHKHDGHAHDGHEHDGHAHDGAKEEDAEAEALRWRVATIRMAVPPLRKAGKAKLVGLLERAILSGDLMLQGREDEEAREVYEQTPSLGALAEILHHAGTLSREQGDAKRGARILKLARYYGQRHRAQQEEREAHEREERDVDERERHERERHERGEGSELEELRRQMNELREQMKRLHKHLEKIARQR